MNSYGRGFRSVLLTATLIVLLAVVATSSRSGFDSSGRPAVSNTYISYAMSVFLIVFVLMIPVAIYSYFLRTKEMATVTKRAPGKRFYRTLIVLVCVGLVVYIRHYLANHGGLFGHGGLFHISSPGSQNGKLNDGAARTAQPHFEWIVLWIALALGVVAAVGAYISYKRRPPLPVREPLTLQEEVVATIDDAIDDLEREPDPRRAVIAAYARMERALGRIGLDRRKSETPIEYLRRVLNELTSRAGAVERLTGLFEQAKFSRHDITEPMKHDAIASLREIRESLGHRLDGGSQDAEAPGSPVPERA